MNRVINDLTDAAKIEAGRLELEPQECPLKEAFHSAVESMRLLFGEKRVNFAAHIPDDGKSLKVDLSRLSQALENLLGNALKFTPPGGSVILKVTPLENEVQVSLTDTGPGIPAEVIDRIFEPYWQGDRTRNGMGLGLFIAKRIIETHGGKIWAQSSPGRGTTFYFTLPAIHTPAAHRSA
jgi:signal transduction histidine kinase